MRDQDLLKIEDVYPMSDIEKGMVYHYLYSNDVLLYQNQMLHQVEINKFDPLRMKKALQLMAEKHPILRTCYNVEDLKDFAHIVFKEIDLCYNLYDISSMSRKEQEEYIGDYLEKDKKTPLDITTPPLWRMAIFQQDEDFICILWTCHHALLDGWSCASFFIELNQIYNALKEDTDYQPNMLKCSYKEYIAEQIIENKKETNIEFWKNELIDYESLDFFNVNQDTMERSLYRQSFGKDFLSKLKNSALEYNTSIKNLCFAAYLFSLYMLSYEDDITVGLLTHCRPVCEDGEKILGCFLNTIPFRIKVPAKITWREFVKLVDKKMLQLVRHEKMSLFEINKIAGNGKYENKPIFDTLFSYQDFHIIGAQSENNQYAIKQKLSIRGYDTPYSNTEALLNLIVNTTFSEFNVTYSFANSSLKYGVEEKLPYYYEGVLNRLIYNKDSIINKYDLVDEHEKEVLFHRFNDTYAEYPRNKTIIELFEDIVREMPDRIAIVYKNEQLTYDELSIRVNYIAQLISREDIRPDRPVAVMFEPSIEMVVCILAVLKVGAAFLPVDPENPLWRNKYILEHSKSQLLLTQSHLKTKVSFEGKSIIIYKDLFCNAAYKSIENVPARDNLAYIIYTSGTTGKPKGVMVNNSSVVNYVRWFTEKTGINENDKTALTSSYSFDLGYTALFTSILCGGELHIIPRDIYLDTEIFLKYISEKQLTYLKMTPSLFSTIAASSELNETNYNLLRLIVLGGEEIRISDVESVYKKCSNINIMNHYGPTEATIGTIAHLINREDLKQYILEPHIGKPINNTKVYLLDKNLNLLPEGVVGEIFIAGDALARGYLNEKELTLEKFVQNPYDASERIYRTGDFGRWLEGGYIEFLGRRDQQVKIRGFRIELGEIEDNLSKLPEIKQVKVIQYSENSEDKYLCAYYTSDKEIPAKELREYLQDKIPEYMIPSFFTRIEAFCLTPNNKLDIKSLAKPEYKRNKVETSSLSETEDKIINIWKDILSTERNNIDLDTNFLEIGGHSLNAIKLISKIHKEFKVKIPLMEFFKDPTVRNVVKIVNSKKASTYSSINVAEKKQYYSLSSQQKRLYILQYLNKNSIVYNQPRAITIEGDLDKVRLEDSFKKLISRHYSYRTSISIINNEPVQKIHETAPFMIQNFEGSFGAVDEIINEFIKPFDLSMPPLLRVGLIKSGDNRHILFIDTHHIISDGVSLGLFIHELNDLYNGYEPALPKLQYKDYSEWQLQEKNSLETKKEETYWLDQFKGDIPVLNLPIDFARPSVQSFEGKLKLFIINKEETSRLKELAIKENVSFYSLMLATFNLFLSKICNQEDIVVGLPVDGRRNLDLAHTIGMFVNTLAIRNYVHKEKSIREFVKEVGKKMIDALENQGYQFEELIEKVHLPKDTSRNPLFDVMFAMQNFEIPKIDMKGLSAVPNEFNHRTSKFDLSMYFYESEGEMLFSLEYCTKLFKDETIDALILCYRNIINVTLDNPDAKILDVSIISPEEKEKILNVFNDTFSEFPHEKTIHRLFEEQVDKTPDKIAVIHSEKHLTYSELNKKANQLAQCLLARNIRHNEPVGIFTVRSLETIIAILAVLKAGCAYVPISSSYPKDRIKYIIDDSKIKVLLTNIPLIDEDTLNSDIIDVTDVMIYNGNSDNLDTICCQENLAYIIYTSGSTGRPKGVIVEHRSAVNLLYSLQKHYPFTENDTYLFKTSCVFDVSVTELFGWFMGGGHVVVLDANSEKDPNSICEIISKYKVTHMNFVPSMFNVFIDALKGKRIDLVKSLKYIFLAGEELLPELVHKYNALRLKASLENLYGPTEGTVYASEYSLSDWDGQGKIPIGKPLDNVNLYVLNKDKQLQPIGLPGELCISGLGVARGYQNNDDLSKEVFSITPFTNGSRMYYTGDLAKWRPDGRLDFLGRVDNQIKIRGFRVELGEIENLLLKFNTVKDAAVILKNNKNSNFLCAYIVMDKKLDKNELKEYLAKYLPDYMVPTDFIQLDSIPVNQSGKVDRNALASIESHLAIEGEHIEPVNDMEKTIADIWKDILGVKKVGIHTNFFELGGNSLDIIRLSNKLSEKIHMDISVITLFEYPTISSLSLYLKRNTQTVDEEYEMVSKSKSRYEEAANFMEQTIRKIGE